MSDVHFFLPELTIDKKITPPSKPGLWKSEAKTVIRGISDAIVIGENSQGVSSIPDIWARPLMFQNFLFSVYKKLNQVNKQALNSLEKRAFQEWKGLLSVLALKSTKLSFENITVTPFSPRERNDRFCKALTMLAPTPVAIEKNKEYSWTDVLLIRFNNIPVGAFSPGTLVYTAVDYNNAFKEKFISGAGKSSIVLDSDGYLCPPTKDKDLLAVGEWITNIKSRLDGLLNTKDETRDTDRLLATMNGKLLDIWLGEIKKQLNLSNDDVVESHEVKVSENIPYFIETKPPSFLKDYGIYDALLHPLEGNDAFIEKNKSDIELKFQRNYYKYNDKSVKHVLIISEKLYSEDYRIWDQLHYTALGNNVDNIIGAYFNKEAGQEIKGKDISFASEGILWIRPELFFLTGTLVSAKNDLSLLNDSESEYNIDTKYILPFKKEILDFFSPAEIKELLVPSYEDRGDKVIFSFRLPVIGLKEGLPIKKLYRKRNAEKGEGLITDIESPVIDIFPNYLGESWRRYYLFQGNTGKFNVSPIVFGSDIELIQKEYPADYLDGNQKVSIVGISGDDCFPEGLAVTGDNGAAGLILLKKQQRSTILEDEWTIGIDFGTSNTNVYKKVGEDGSSEHWAYDFPNYTRTIARNSSDLRARLFNDYFIPTKKIDLPITTTIKMYNRDNDENKNILTDFFIYFPEDKKYEFPGFVLSNIKWDGEIINTKYFLKNLLFLILVEVVHKNAANVILAYSWPKAFSAETMGYFKGTWESVYEDLIRMKKRVVNAKSLASTGNVLSIDPPTLNVSEGVAAGEFFASKLGKLAGSRLRLASVCMDVGGGTTDISVWWNNAIIEDFSVKFAGGEISGLLEKSEMLRKMLFSPEACIALKAKQGNPTKFSAVLNHVLKVEEYEINARLINLANDEKVRRFRQMIAIEFGALAYYAGMVCFSVGVRNDNGGRSLLSEISDGGMTLYWGGNAAKLLGWIDLGKYKEDGLAAFLLNSLFFNCLSDKSLGERSLAISSSKLMQVQSPRHKSEASGGLVAINWRNLNQEDLRDKTQNDDDMTVDTSEDGLGSDTSQSGKSQVICGENMEIKGKKIPFYSLVSDSTFFDNNQTLFDTGSLQGLERLTKFITIINAIGIRKGFFTEDTKINLSDQERRAIADSITSEFYKNQSTKASKRVIEPIFIMEVRAMMDILWNKWIK